MKNIATALLKVQQELDPVKKGKKGYNYTYAELPAILDEAVGKLNEAGIVVLQPIQPATMEHHARVETVLIHADSGEQIVSAAEVPWRSDSKMNDAQSYGSAVTYARRYSLVSLLAISTEDDDGKSAYSKPKPETKPVAASKKEEVTTKEERQKAEAKTGKLLTELGDMDTYAIATWLAEHPDEVKAIIWIKRKCPDLYAELQGIGVEVE